ncbi:MAG: arsenite efflux transporter metallochaperone ArsD [Actinomycetota bacterium]
MSKLTIQIFDPPMCCPTGMCGPTIDPALIEIHEAVGRVEKEYNGKVEVRRHLFGKDVQPFLSNKKVLSLIREEGPSTLPITTVDGEIIKSGSYPSYNELKSLAEKHI